VVIGPPTVLSRLEDLGAGQARQQELSSPRSNHVRLLFSKVLVEEVSALSFDREW